MNPCAVMCHPEPSAAPRAFLAFTGVIAFLLSACGSSVQGPKTGPHTNEVPVKEPALGLAIRAGGSSLIRMAIMPPTVRLADGTLVYYSGDWKAPRKES